MGALEVVVRPVVFPNIRPQPARSLPAVDDPTQGICEITGSGNITVQFSDRTNWSITYGKLKEIKRRVDVARVYQKNDDGTVNKDNFVDIEVANKLWMEGPSTPGVGFGTPGVGSESAGTSAKEMETWFLQHFEPDKNVEVKEKDKIKERK